METKLKELGLNEYERKVYVDLVRVGASSGGEIARRSGVPQGKVYFILQSLEDKGFVTSMNTKPKIFSSISPGVAIKQVTKEKIDKLMSLQKEAIRDFENLGQTESKNSISEKIQVSSGKKSRYALNDYLFEKAKKEVSFMHTYEARNDSFVRLVNETIRRGVNIRFLAIKVDENSLKWMKEDVGFGVEVKYLPVDDIRIQIMDNSESRISVVNPKDTRDRVTIYFHHGEMSKHLKSYFDSLWQKAKKVNLKTKLGDLK